MTPENFCYWIQGLLELTPDLKTLNEDQVKMIRQHLQYVFSRPGAAPSPDDLKSIMDRFQPSVQIC